jgi:Peptidase family M50
MSGPACASVAPHPPVTAHRPSKSLSSSAFLLLLFVAALLIGVVLQLAGPAWLSNMFHINAGLAGSPLTLLLALAVSVVVHELGHLIPSLCFGFYVSRIVLGPLSVSRAHGRWKLRYSRAWFVASVSAFPPDERAWRVRMLTVIAGGPIATLCAFLAAAYLLQVWGPGTSAACFLCGVAQLNLFLFVLGLVPNSSDASVRNDARLLLTLLENGCEAEQIRLYHYVTCLQITGVRPSSYPRQLIARLATATGNYDLMLFNALSIFLWALDSGDIATADVWDRYAISLLEDHALKLADTVRSESACFDVLYRNNPFAAIEKLRVAKKETLSPWLKHRSEAVLKIAQAPHLDALLSLRNARVSFPAPLPYFQFESNILDLLERRATVSHSKPLAAHAAA